MVSNRVTKKSGITSFMSSEYVPPIATNPHSMHFARVSTTHGWQSFIESLGLNPEVLLKSVGLSLDIMSDPDNQIPYLAVAQLMELSAQETKLEDFGIQLAARWPSPLQIGGPVGLLMQLMLQSPTVGEAWQYFCQHYHLHSQGVGWTLDCDHKYAYLIREGFLASKVSSFQAVTMNLSHVLKLMRSLCNDEDWAPSFISFTHTAPKNLNIFSHHFGGSVRFGEEISCMAFPVEMLGRKICYSNDQLQELLAAKLDELEGEAEGGGNFVSRLEIMIRQGLRNGCCSQSDIARQMLLHPKKLQRELKIRNLCFRELKVKVRLELAEHFIKHTTFPLTAIAEMLGYSALSVLSRSFKEHHQLSPIEWRQQNSA